MDLTYIPIVVQSYDKTGFDYIKQRADDLKLAKKLYIQYKYVEYWGKGWIKIGGIVINSINREDMEKIEKEINQQN